VNADSILVALLRLDLVASVTILLVLVLRPFVLGRLGAGLAYWLWILVPIAAFAGILPARAKLAPVASIAMTDAAPAVDEESLASGGSTLQQAAEAASGALPFAPADVLLILWLSGAGLLLLRSIASTRRIAADPSTGPALVGVFRPRLVLPADFETRFDAAERALILAHEEEHRISRHTLVNGAVELARCLNWFNPLFHLAATRLRADQELACDAAVIAANPGSRRAYAEALLKTQIAPGLLPMGCTWTSLTARRLHERITLLDRPSRHGRRTAGVAAIGIAGFALGYAAWAQQPPRLVTQAAPVPAAVWTATADAPKGALSTALEGDRHDRAIARARKGDIDIVFFGTTNAEMWSWPDRGRAVWDRRLAPLKAANFGSQGTLRDSLVWRMQNGELAGFRAKLVVLQTWLGAGEVTNGADTLATYSPIVAEIRRWQPQAKILLFADIPRGQLDRDGWRKVAKGNAAAFAPLVDGKTVFHVDMGERFFRPDGSHNQAMWRFPPISGNANAGMQPAGFEAWADELQPWLDRFIR